MKAMRRTTFYPVPDVERALVEAETKKVSERINELIVKGLAKEEEDRIKAGYEHYAQEISKTAPRKKNKRGVSAAMTMAHGLFAPEDEPDDWF